MLQLDIEPANGAGHPDDVNTHPADRVNFCMYGESGEQNTKYTKPDMSTGFCNLLAYVIYYPQGVRLEGLARFLYP